MAKHTKVSPNTVKKERFTKASSWKGYLALNVLRNSLDRRWRMPKAF
jgi:hypothetical protein